MAPNARGRGIGKRMVCALASATEEPLRAETREGNEASDMIAIAAGMTFVRQDGAVRHFERPYGETTD